MVVFRSPLIVLGLLTLAACGSSNSGTNNQPGQLTVTITAPSGVTPSVQVTGPGGFHQTLSATQTLSNLVAGSYAVSADPRPSPGAVFPDESYQGTVSGSPANVTAGGSASVTVTYALQTAGHLWVIDSNFSFSGFLGYSAAQLEATTDSAPSLSVDVGLPAPAYGVLDANGNLWVAGFYNRVVSFSAAQLAATGTPEPRVVLSSTAFNNPSGIAFDSSGALWVSNISGNTLLKFTPNQLAASGDVTPAVTLTASAGSLSAPRAIAFRSGTLWVSNAGNNTVVAYLASNQGSGANVPDVILSANGTSLAGPRGLAFDAAGNLWVANTNTPSLVRFAANQLVTGSPIPAATITDTAITTPQGLVVDTSGNLFAANVGNSTLLKYAANHLGGGSTPPDVVISSSAGSLAAPVGLFQDSGGDLWAINAGYPFAQAPGSLAKFTPAQLATSGSPTPALQVHSYDTFQTYGAAFDASGNLWAASCNPNAISMYPAGYLLGGAGPTVPIRLSGSTSSGGGFNCPTGLAFDGAGNLWAVNYFGSSIVRFSPAQLATGGAVTADLTLNVTPGILNGPLSLAFDPQGQLWVANYGTNQLLGFSQAQLSGSGGSSPAFTISANAGSLNGPEGLAFDSQGQLWVANFNSTTLNSSLVRFAPSDLANSGSPVPGVVINPNGSSLSSPLGLALDSAGNLWVGNQNGHSVVKFAAADLAASGSPAPVLTLTQPASFLSGVVLLEPHATGLPLKP